MQSEAIFENIADRIVSEINRANKSIIIAVAWFTNSKLFDALVKKAHSDCNVLLIISDDDINNNAFIDFNELNINNSRVYKIGDGVTELMHNKFCVIDFSTIITGSYNWSYKAESNFENIIITQNDSLLAEQFINEFFRIRNRFFPNDIKRDELFPVNLIIKRLEIIENYIVLEDTHELSKETLKLKEYGFNDDIANIINAINDKEYANAIFKIQAFINSHNQLIVYNDSEISALKLEIKNLENQINAYNNEKAEIERRLSAFQHRHITELGNTILKILKIKKQIFANDKEKLNEIANDEQKYQTQYKKENRKKVFSTTPEKTSELKQKYRKATAICHPDKVNDDLKEAALKIFLELNEAYNNNDLRTVSDILSELERGSFFITKSESLSEFNLLRTEISKLKRQAEIFQAEIVALKTSDTYKNIFSIDDWDKYFNQTKELLLEELDDLQNTNSKSLQKTNS